VAAGHFVDRADDGLHEDTNLGRIVPAPFRSGGRRPQPHPFAQVVALGLDEWRSLAAKSAQLGDEGIHQTRVPEGEVGVDVDQLA